MSIVLYKNVKKCLKCYGNELAFQYGHYSLYSYFIWDLSCNSLYNPYYMVSCLIWYQWKMFYLRNSCNINLLVFIIKHFLLIRSLIYSQSRNEQLLDANAVMMIRSVFQHAEVQTLIQQHRALAFQIVSNLFSNKMNGK